MARLGDGIGSAITHSMTHQSVSGLSTLKEGGRMPVYAGVLTEIGSAIANRNMVQRTFIQIGPQRLMSVVTSPYLDDHLQKAVGGQTKLGIWKWPMYGTQLVSIQMADGSRHTTDEVPGAGSGLRSQMIMTGGVIAIAGSLFLGLMMGNLGVVLCLVGGVLWPYLGRKSLRQAIELR
jgi:hypothetical protein